MTPIWYCLAFFCAAGGPPQYIQVGPFDTLKRGEDVQAFLAETCDPATRPDRYRCWSIPGRAMR